MIVLLAACGDPLSNAALLEDDAFLAVLPTSDRLFAPGDLLAAPSGIEVDPALRAAVDAAYGLAPVLVLVTGSGDALRATTPDVREAGLRQWFEVPAVGLFDGVLTSWWVNATVAGDPDAALAWSIDGAPDREAPYALLGAGSAEAGVANAYWDLAGSGATLDVGPLTGVVAIGWWEQSPGLPVTSVSYYSAPYDAVPLARWVAWGDSGVAIQGWLAVTEDGATWPGQLAVAHGATGGRALGVVDTDAGELIIERCWGPTGVTTWSDEGGVETGDPSTCVLSDVAPVADLL